MDAKTPESLTAKDAKKLAGLSYRQLNDWESRGAIPGKRGKESTWRRFTPKQIFALMVAKEIRDSYGIPVEKIRFVIDFMMKEDCDHLSSAIRMMKYGLHVFLLTDFEETFIMDSDREFADMMEHGTFRNEDSGPHIFLRLNGLVNRLLAATNQPAQIETSERLYRLMAEHDASLRVRTVAEHDLLQAIRSGGSKRIEIRINNGEIEFIGTEGNVELKDLDVSGGVVKVRQDQENEDLEILTRDGKVVEARRNLPRKYTKKDNKTAIFVLQLDTTEDDFMADR